MRVGLWYVINSLIDMEKSSTLWVDTFPRHEVLKSREIKLSTSEVSISKRVRKQASKRVSKQAS